jgi:hypothetical protein
MQYFLFLLVDDMVPHAKNKQPTRRQQPYTSGLGKVFTSPTKRRNKLKSTTLVAPLGLDARKKHLLDHIRCLKLKAFSTNTGPYSDSDAILEGPSPNDDSALESCDAFDISEGTTCSDPFDFNGGDVGNVLDPTSPIKIRRTLPDATAHGLYNRWMARLPSLVPSLSLYVTRTTGVPLEPITELRSTCSTDRQGTCHRQTSTILCLFFDRMFVLTSVMSNIYLSSTFQISRASTWNHVNVLICFKSWYPTVSSRRHHPSPEWPYPSTFLISTMLSSSDHAML